MPVTGAEGVCLDRPVFQPGQQSTNASVPSYRWQILPTVPWGDWGIDVMIAG